MSKFEHPCHTGVQAVRRTVGVLRNSGFWYEKLNLKTLMCSVVIYFMKTIESFFNPWSLVYRNGKSLNNCHQDWMSLQVKMKSSDLAYPGLWFSRSVRLFILSASSSLTSMHITFQSVSPSSIIARIPIALTLHGLLKIKWSRLMNTFSSREDLHHVDFQRNSIKRLNA